VPARGPGPAHRQGPDLIARAGAILFAGSLVNVAATRWAPPGCVIADSKDMTLEQMAAWLIEQAGRCETVVRLQTGDPALYGALIELVQPLDAAGVPLRVVPGVSSAMASAAAAVESFTLPEVTQTTIFTRVEGRTPMPAGEDLAALAAHRSTLCIFLSITLLHKVEAGCARPAGRRTRPCSSSTRPAGRARSRSCAAPWPPSSSSAATPASSARPWSSPAPRWARATGPS
jgi:precorrin-4 methylase